MSDSDVYNFNTIDEATENSIIETVQSKTSQLKRQLREFFSNSTLITPKGDPTTNVSDQNKGKTFCIPDAYVNPMFMLLEKCRRENHTLHYSELQKDKSGIMLDFDLYQTVSRRQVENSQISMFIQDIATLLTELLDINTNETHYCIVIQKPKVAYCGDSGIFKDGFHILFPTFWVTKAFKKYFIHRLIEDECIKNAFEGLDFIDANDDYSGIIDKQSASVPVLFLGNSKSNKKAYDINNIYKIQIKTNGRSIRCAVAPLDKTTWEDWNLTKEFSLSFLGDKIEKKEYEPSPSVSGEIQDWENKIVPVSPDEFEDPNGELSLLSLQDPEAKDLQNLLSILDERRSEDRNKWRDVIYAIANTSASYKPLAVWFSQKCPDKWDAEEFERIWSDAVNRRVENPLTLGSIKHWASVDNPERYNEFKQMSLVNRITSKVFDGVTDGLLGHYDIATILYYMLEHKFRVDCIDKKSTVWFEFVMPEDDHQKGEVYKWRRETFPFTISKYVSEKLPILFQRVHDYVKQRREDPETSRAHQDYYNSVILNLKKTIRSMSQNQFKNGIIKEACVPFLKRGFIESLDKNPDILGVGNGLIRLGKEPLFIEGYHTYTIEKFTKVDYMPYDPDNYYIKVVEEGLKMLFPEDEHDAYKFCMLYAASCLDGKPKNSIIFIATGAGSNGKSFFAELLKTTLGELYGVKLPMSMLTDRKSRAEGPTPNLMKLKYARLAHFSETNKHESLNTARVKELTGQETISGRDLHESTGNFRPHCHYYVTTNNTFDIDTTDHGTWRRIKIYNHKVQFVEYPDPSNPLQKKENVSYAKEMTADPRYQSAFLSIIVEFYKELWTKYDGNLFNVPHPTIIRETEEYRDTQDKINKFINTRIVKLTDVTHDRRIPLTEVAEGYIEWFEHAFYQKKFNKDDIVRQLVVSKLNKSIVKELDEFFLVNHRVLERGQHPKENEHLVGKVHVSETNQSRVNRQLSNSDSQVNSNSDVSQQVNPQVNAQVNSKVDGNVNSKTDGSVNSKVDGSVTKKIRNDEEEEDIFLSDDEDLPELELELED